MGSVPGEDRITRGLRLSREAFMVIRDDRGLLGLALAAVTLDLMIGGAFLGGASAMVGNGHRRLVLVLAACLASYPITVVGTFFNVALLSTVSRRWAAEPATVAEGLRLARSRIGVILVWSLIAATIGSVLSLAEKVNHFAWIERLVAYALELAWGVATFFVIPALAVDGVGPREALRRSVRTVRRRWAEGTSGTIAISGAAGVLLLPGVLIGFIGYEDLASKPTSGVVLLAIGVALALPVLVYSNATSAVFTLAVYCYAQDLPACGLFAEADLASPFVGGRKAGRIRSWLGRIGVRRG